MTCIDVDKETTLCSAHTTEIWLEGLRPDGEGWAQGTGDLPRIGYALGGTRAKLGGQKKERKKRDNPREGWEDGTPPPHRDFKEGTVWC